MIYSSNYDREVVNKETKLPIHISCDVRLRSDRRDSAALPRNTWQVEESNVGFSSKIGQNGFSCPSACFAKFLRKRTTDLQVNNILVNLTGVNNENPKFTRFQQPFCDHFCQELLLLCRQ